MQNNKLHPTYRANNRWQLPDLLPQPEGLVIPTNLTAYAYRQNIPSHEQALLHFHIDDYRFQIVWNRPQTGLATIQRQHAWAICSPDFSLWAHTPQAEQIWNIYRARWCARYWQEAGLLIIPTVNWSTPDSWEFCFAGIPQGQIVTLRTPKRFTSQHWKYFFAGYEEMTSVLAPRLILWFSDRIPYRCLIDSIPKIQFSASDIRQKGAGTWAAQAEAVDEDPEAGTTDTTT